MARKKEYIFKATQGISQKEGEGISQNMINLSGYNQKRQGHKNISEFTDVDLNPLRINGIYDYHYIDESNENVSTKIVHAGNKLFRCDESFLTREEIPLDGEIKIKDEKSQAFLLGKRLFIAGAGELLFYDGEAVRRIYGASEVYIPTTSCKITDQENGMESTRCESPNLLTPRRINKFIGSNLYRESNKTNVFLLDTNIKYNTKFVLDIRIRTRTGEEEISTNTTSYIGINEAGEEVGTIVNIRFARDSIEQNASLILSEPIRDDDGNIINLKIGDTVYTYDNLDFSASLKNYRELCLPFEVVTPILGEDNISVEFEAQETNSIEIMQGSKLLSLSNCENGKELLVVNFGDNKLHFSDKDKGIFHIPTDNEISFGGDNEPITAIIRLSENLIGVFKKNSFYRVRFTSSNDDGYEAFLSSASVGAYNQESACVVNYDCLVFNREGVFGVSDYKSTQNVFDSLRSRSFKINELLRAHTKAEKENAVAIVSDKRYYLFIGNKAYIADTRYRVNGTGSDGYGYEWWQWTGVGARVAYSDEAGLYLGTENGQIRMFTSDNCDIDERVYKTSELSLLCRQAEGYTEFVLPDDYESNDSSIMATLSAHKVLLKKGVEYKEGALCLDVDMVLSSEGAAKIYPDMKISVYDQAGELACEAQIENVSLLTGTVEINDALTEGASYDIYLSSDEDEAYGLERVEDAYILLKSGERITLKDTEDITLTIRSQKSIECEYKTMPLCFDLPTQKKTLKGLYLKLPGLAKGTIKLELETKKAKLQREIDLGKALDFDSLDFDSLSFDSELDILVPVSAFLRGFEYLTLKITSNDSEMFGIDTIYFQYTVVE